MMLRELTDLLNRCVANGCMVNKMCPILEFLVGDNKEAVIYDVI